MTAQTAEFDDTPRDVLRRAQMVEDQIVRRGIGDPAVLAAMRAIPRHLFVPASMADAAYEDRALAIGEGQTISQPYIVAAMTSLLRLSNRDRVLEVGTGSGYQAAILGFIARTVISIERKPALADAARRRLAALHCDNVRVMTGDGTYGVAEEGPFDAILVAAAAPRVPHPLVAQLTESGRLVVPVGSREVQDLMLVQRQDGRIVESRCDPCVFVPLIGRYGWDDSVSEI